MSQENGERKDKESFQKKCSGTREKQNPSQQKRRGFYKRRGPKPTVAIPQEYTAFNERAKTLSEQLTNETYECPICLDIIYIRQGVSGCPACNTTFHLKCVQKWAKAPQAGAREFSCPQCRHVSAAPEQYVCYCGKTVCPKFDPFVIPHSCGNVCGRVKKCGAHYCNQLCHPGPCPECTEVVQNVHCPCGEETYSYLCGQEDPKYTCQHICNKLLNCGVHRCSLRCHHGECSSCNEIKEMVCPCGRESAVIRCGEEFFCKNTCGKPLRCSNHTCQLLCHKGVCPPCNNDVDSVKTCPCGSTSLPKDLRKSCLDPVPTCEGKCKRFLNCGKHRCKLGCHTGDCPTCEEKASVLCQCGLTRTKVLCGDADTVVLCDHPCGTKLSCGKHYCKILCCPEKKKKGSCIHECTESCTHTLKCGHQCAENCHTGPCPPCIHVTSEPLRCRCGACSIPPPQPCGTAPPSCGGPCKLTPACGHKQPFHPCHYGDCPPCMTLRECLCVGGHKTISVPCSQIEGFCDAICGKLLDCGHTCPRTCHSGACVEAGKPCQSKCGKIHEDCGHPCTKSCHLNTSCERCKHEIELICRCGNRVKIVPCFKYAKMVSAYLESNPGKEFELKCDDDCLKASRLSVLGSLRSFTSPKRIWFSLHLWNTALEKKDLILSVEKILGQFVEGKESFITLPAFQREKRIIVHELSNFYGVKSQSLGSEPHRTMMLDKTPSTALPSVRLSEAVKRGECNPHDLIKQEDKRTMLLSGEYLSESTVNALLFECIGTFVFQEVDMQSAFLLFASQKDCTTAYTLLKQRNCPFTARKML